MKVLLIAPDFPPVLNSAARLFSELAEDLVSAGHRVTVLTQMPARSLAPGTRRHRGRLILKEDRGGIKVWGIKNLPVPRRLPMARALDQFWMAWLFTWIGLFLPRQEAIIVYSPPLPLGLTGYALAKRWRGQVVINVQDLYPQTAVDLGLLKNKFLIRWVEKLESFLYRRADGITVHSEGNREYVISKGAAPHRTHTFANWVDLVALKPGPQINVWRAQHGLEKAFVVSFAGTVGFAQGLEEVVHVAERLGRYPDLVFVIAGDGVLKDPLQKEAVAKGLNNIKFLPPQPPEAYLQLLQASDVCLVTLHKDLKTPVVPGKLQSIMAAGRPVICCANPASDARRLVEESGCGIFVPAGDASGLMDAVLRVYLRREVAEEMGKLGRRYAERNFDRKKCTQMYTSLLNQIETKSRGQRGELLDRLQDRL